MKYEKAEKKAYGLEEEIYGILHAIPLRDAIQSMTFISEWIA